MLGIVQTKDARGLLRRVRDLVLQVGGLVIAAELAQRRFVQLEQNLAQLLGFGIAGRETLSVNLSQRADEGISVFAADFAIHVAVTIVEACLAHHAALHCTRNRQHPPAATIWQLKASVRMPSGSPSDSLLHDGRHELKTGGGFKRALVRLDSQGL
jgi:hypothetical protein